MNIVEHTPEEIVDLIKDRKWKHDKEFPIETFVKKVAKNTYAVDGKFIIQSKPEAIDYDFVKKMVRKAKKGKEFRNKAVVVFFPESANIDGKMIPSGSYRLLDRTHGMVIDAMLGYTMKFAYVVNFKKHLGSDEGTLWRLANKLNDPKAEEEQGLLDAAIRDEIHRLMDRRVRAGLEPTPSKAERESFLKAYAQLDIKQWSAYVSTHEFGGRRLTTKMWTKEELRAKREDLSKDPNYEGYFVAVPAHVAAWDSSMGAVLLEKEVIKGANKILLCFHSTTAAQTKKLENNFYQPKIEEKAEELKTRFNIEELEYVVLDTE